MLRFAFLVAVAGCAGVSSQPKQSWADAQATFADAHCRWYFACGDFTEAGCAAEVASAQSATETDLASADRDPCAQCMTEWAAVYEAHTSPCSQTPTYDEMQALAPVCGLDHHCFRHDLPGDGRFGP